MGGNSDTSDHDVVAIDSATADDAPIVADTDGGLANSDDDDDGGDSVAAAVVAATSFDLSLSLSLFVALYVFFFLSLCLCLTISGEVGSKASG